VIEEATMKIVVIGGTGLIGSKLVEKLRRAGHDVLAAAPASGVNTLTGEGLADAFEDARVVVDVSNAPSWGDAAVLEFFQTSTRNILAAEATLAVGHHVALSVVGADRMPDSGYMRAKLAQEDAIKAGTVPYTIVRATQFFEFMGRIADSSTVGETVRLAPVLFQPEAADDVAATLADVAVSAPANGTIELAGPERFRFDELVRRALKANEDPRTVTADPHARYFGAELNDDSLIPDADAGIAPTRFADWLDRTTVKRTRPEGGVMATSASDTAPNTIVLIHGFWVTPRSWENWKSHFEAKGYTVLAPAYPGFEVEVEALRADPTPIEKLEVPEIIDMLENMIGKLDRPPIIMGHSAGGVFTQILLDHGFGAVGVAIDSAPTEGVKVVPLSEIRSGFPILKNPANRHRAVGFTPEQWHYVFANTFDEQESLALYERYHIPASGRVFWGSALANIHPGKDDTYVDYHNDSRPPLLFIAGKQDHLFPPKVGHSNAKHYKSKSVTEIVEFDGPHLLPAIPGWEVVADFALDWALKHATPAPAT
jgi:uncharacterized protein YbjT (DUF2867 family)/alpha-beta hydrolase superfamily lysophospholipase